MLITIPNQKINQSNNLFDISKLILAVMVVGIHTPLPEYFFPWLRLAVPLFFMMTSYFLFSKLKTIDDKNTRKATVKKFVIRNAKLYIFYSLLLSPIIIALIRFDFLKEHFSYGFFRGIYSIIQMVLFKGTFTGSWYIVSSILGVVIIALLSAHMNNKCLFAITFVSYIFACINSSYIELFTNIKPIVNFANVFTKIFVEPECSFLVSCFWLCLGKIIAEHSFKLKNSLLCVLLVCCAALLYIEWLFVKRTFGTLNNDCYFMLIPICTIAFLIVKDIKFTTNKLLLDCRKTSTIIYALHGAVLTVWGSCLRKFLNISNQYLLFISTVIICICASIIFLKLKDKKYFTWLKLSY